MTAYSEPEKSAVEKMLEGMTSEILLPLMKMSDRGELPVVHAQWVELRSHIKQQVASIYFGTHHLLEEGTKHG